MKYTKTYEEYTPEIPNTKVYYHGGNLDNYDDFVPQKNGRYEFGSGLYLIDHLETARKYAKGNRKLYKVTVELGNDIQYAILNIDDCLKFIKENVIATKRNLVISRINEHVKNKTIKAYIFNNTLINTESIKPSKTTVLEKFYVEHNIDYDIINNAFGWGEDMMVLYNMNKIKNIKRI